MSVYSSEAHVGAFFNVIALLQNALDTPTVWSSMDFSGKLAGILLVVVGCDARKVMAQYHQNMFFGRIVNLTKISSSPQAIIPFGLSEGFDKNEMIDEHNKQSGTFLNLLALRDGKVTLKSPDGKDLTVHLVVSVDGAARKELSGRTPYTATHPLTWNHLNRTDVKNVHKFAPITLNQENMKPHRPDPTLTLQQRKAWSREHFGVFAENPTGLDMIHFLPELLHRKMLIFNRLMAMTIKSIELDENTDVATFYAHCRDPECLGLRYDFGYVDSEGLVSSNLKGNACEKLRYQCHRIVHCKKHALMTTEDQRDAITRVWLHFDRLLDDDANRDPKLAVSFSEYFTMTHRALLVGVAVWGPDFITPTLVHIRG